MADNSAFRLGFLAVVGFLLIEVGITGKLGSLLGSIIAPISMQDFAGSGNHTGVGINPASLPTTGTLSPKQIGEYMILAGFQTTESALTTGIAIALAESGGNIKATHKNANGSTDYGVWQINSVHGYDPQKLLTPAGNAAAAYTVSNKGTNWSPWTTYATGAYQNYISQAQQGALQAIAGMATFGAV